MTTTTIVAHDAHVACRATFIAARTAMVQAAVTKRARAATRAATRATVRATTKVVRAVAVAKKEAAEKHASVVRAWTVRCTARATAKAANAPAIRASKKAAASEAKALRAIRNMRLAAVRVMRMAAKVAPVIKAAMVAIDKATTRHTMVAPAATVCVAIPAHDAHVHAYKAVVKATNKAANKVHAAIKAPRCTLNSLEKRASIHDAQVARINARTAIRVKTGTSISLKTIEARLAQGAAQKAANAARKAGMPAKVGVVHTPIVRSGPTKVRGAKRAKVYHMAHTVESALAQVAKKEAIVKAKEDAQIAKAKKWALRKEAYAARKATMEQIASDAWMLKGVWLPEDLIRSANDWSYSVRIGAFKEARAIAYAKAPVAQVAVAA